MGKIGRVTVVVVSLAALSFAGLSILVWRTGYSISEMDWNSDGTTSLEELLVAIDVARRPATVNGVSCYEYFRLKDGLPIRIDCNKHEKINK